MNDFVLNLITAFCSGNFRLTQYGLYKKALRKKPYFPGPGISQKAQKDHANIIFPLTFWLRKRPYFPSPKSSKQELFSNK